MEVGGVAHVCRRCGYPVNLSVDDRAEILRRFAAGESAVEIAEALGVSRRSVYRVTDRVRHPDDTSQLDLPFAPADAAGPQED